MDERTGEFYVGYLPSAPPRLARRTLVSAVAVVLGALLLATVLVTAQSGFGLGVFEYGTEREFRGVIEADPYPVLAVERPGNGHSRYLLSAKGKHGALDIASAFVGQSVRLRGTLAHREGITMIEIADDGIRADGATTPRARDAPIGVLDVTLAGEIVDSKCYLGVMKPGSTKPHRDCAVRCISGGIPPVLLVRDGNGDARYYLLAGPGGESLNRAVLEFVAEPIEVTGRVQRLGDLELLRADPARFRRLP